MSATPPPPVTLVTGTEEFLVERAVARVVAAARAADPEADIRRLVPSDLGEGRLAEIASPSLFGETTVLVLERAHEIGADAAGEVVAYLTDPAEHVALVVLHSGQANRAKALLEATRKAGAVEVGCPKVARVGERVGFVREEAKRAGRQLSEDAARTLVDAVGADLRELAAATAQLAADTDGPITPEVVLRYYAGRAEVTSFQVADLAVEGRTTEALVQLRWALGCGVAPVLVTSALAQGLRTLVRVGSAPRGLGPADIAREAGVPPWKVDVARRQLRGWGPDGLATAIQSVARADALVKGKDGVTDPAYALERTIVDIGRARG